jgi:hypothetical protein|tara:strand:- start:403 stop:531 length:129 start_codon:yes stop_codon:yes gene_type:complete
MLILGSILLATFIFYSVLFSEDPPDDNDDMDGGMMIPSYNPI